jgi:protein-tyrosine phosphatase
MPDASESFRPHAFRIDAALSSGAMVRVCFVCLGNICRSPTAEGVMKKLVADAGLSHVLTIRSAGTAGYHQGEPADARARSHAAERGYLLDQRARQFRDVDFDAFDYVVALDSSNATRLLALARTDEEREKVKLLRAFDPESPPDSDVPDPYYGGDEGFSAVIDLCERACAGLLEHLRRTHALR